MRILHASDELCLEAGGVVRAVLDLANGLNQAGAEVTLVSGDISGAPQSWRDGTDGHPRVVSIDRSVTPTLRPRHAGAEIARLVEGVDLVHLHKPWDPLHLAIAKAARRAGKPYVLSVHGMLDDWCMDGKAFKKRLYLRAFGKRLLEQAAWIHFTAEAERDQAMKWVPRATPFVEPLLMDLSPYSRLPGPEEARQRFPRLAGTSEPRILFLSRVDPKKGIDLLIRSVAGLEATGQPTQAFIAGPGESGYIAKLKQLAEQLGVSDRIHFLGMVKGSLKWSLYQAADLFVLPTHQENFGIVLVEAMACELVTLTTKRVDIWQELQRHGAVIVDDDTTSITTGLRELLAELPAHQQTALANRDAVFDWLAPSKIIQRYLDAYQAAIDGVPLDQS